MTDNQQSQMAKQARQESEFIKRIGDFARYMVPEYINGSANPRSMMIIAADCVDEKQGKHALAQIMVGDNRVGRCALRSMMEDNDTFSAIVHELCEEDGENRSIEELDEDIARKKNRLKISICTAVVITLWSASLVFFQAAGLANWMTTISSLLLMALCGMFIGRDIRTLRASIGVLHRLRKHAVGRQRIMSRAKEFTEFLRRMRDELEGEAGEDDDD